MTKFNIVRMFKNGAKRVVKRNVTLAEAQAHCQDPETSSSTCKGKVGKRRTREKGDWFDGYARA